MAIYFECAARYDKMLENGAVKKVTEKFLVDALSFTEAETTFIEKITPYISGKFSIPSIKKTRISEIINPVADRFFLAKVAFISLDENTGVERKSISQILVGGTNYDEAKDNFEEGMRDTVTNYELQSLSETLILDVFLHTSKV